jgi:outer membrane protein OmpA-like peptidoglycan-associated protein
MSHRIFATATIAALIWCGAVLAGSPELSTLSYPEKQSVDLVFAKMDTAPAKAKVKGTVKYEAGQAKVSLSFSDMEPAVLFGGDIASYVVWAINPTAAPENMGEMIVTKKGQSGSQTYTTGKKDFAIMITAEPYYLVGRPCDIVLFASSPKDTKKYTANTFIFQDFRPGPKAAVASISGLKFENKTPVPVLQAESVLALIDRLGAGDVNPAAVKSATIALGEAKATKDDKKIADASRRSISSSADALRDWAKAKEQLAAAEAAAKLAADKAALQAKHAAELAALEAQAAATAGQLSQTEAQKAEIAQQLSQVEAQRAALAQANAQIKAQNDALAARLQSALSSVAATTKTARGTVTSLSGVLFDTGKSTIKPEAKITLAKLAGVMLVFGKTTIQVEGYTDNVGSDATNLKLSEARAKAVRDFLESQGIASNRLTSVGKGPADPVAPNDTPEGRAQNRRVEIISSEPQL